MSRVALLVGVAVLIALALFLVERGTPKKVEVAAEAAPPVAARAPARVERKPAAVAAEQPPVGDVTLHGVLLRGAGGAESQALLKVDGHSEQPYRVGDPVVRGWSVHEIRGGEAVLRQGSNRTTIAMTTAQATAGSGPPPAASKPPAPAPGFMAGPPPILTDAGASERNRRFLEAVQSRAQAR